MKRQSEHPSRDDLLVMAYVDDELADEQRDLFHYRLADEPRLARQVAAYQKLAVLARQMAPAEPTDLEWARLQSSAVHRGGVGIGWLLLGLGFVLYGIWSCFAVAQSELSLLGKCSILIPSLGFVLLLVIRIRDRRRLLPLDPYTDIER